ncbi:MAG: hypothetical protein OXC07_01110 [Kistimonas sp.]|nr:hypothetical protein [Kistimonas sp.]
MASPLLHKRTAPNWPVTKALAPHQTSSLAMRDLGLMGESTFVTWCANAGLIPNGSQIDKTGWDFLVEFPFKPGLSPHEIHRPAFECKVQVKATDKNHRKLPITLSNLRRLATVQMPAFFVFIEFDKKEIAQRAFVVHVDNQLITKVLKRLHEVEQSAKKNNFNKKKMTIHYDESNILEATNGACLKERFLAHVSNDISDYISNKKSHLESTGYENGCVQASFTIEGIDNLNSLIDVSLGISKKEVDITKLRGVDARFGIKSSIPGFSLEIAKLALPKPQPMAGGKIRFREDRLSAGLVFPVKIFLTPFNGMVPNELKKMRVEGGFFDLILTPYKGIANYSFSFGEGFRLEIKEFSNALKLLSLLFSSGKNVIAELISDSFPKFDFSVRSKHQDIDFSNELKALESAAKILNIFGASEKVDISFTEIKRYSNQIFQMESVMVSPPSSFSMEFSLNEDNYDNGKEIACIFLSSTPIGSHLFGFILVLTGGVKTIGDNRYQLLPKEVNIAKHIFSDKDEPISNDELISAIESIKEVYKKNFNVISYPYTRIREFKKAKTRHIPDSTRPES